MGAIKVYDQSQIKDNVGLYLFGGQNYEAADGVVPCVVPGGYDLFFLCGVLENKFPEFPGYVNQVADLYERVMQHAAPLEEARVAHRRLDRQTRSFVGDYLRADGVKPALAAEMRNLGNSPVHAWFASRFGVVPGPAVANYFARSASYNKLVADSRTNLSSQLDRLESVGDEMDEFRRLLNVDISGVTRSIAAKNQIQILHGGGVLGCKIAMQLDVYISKAIAMLPKFCQRRNDLKGVLQRDDYTSTYLQDGLSPVSLRL